MKLSVVIICWNDLRVIRDCLRSIFEGTHTVDFEVIISDNNSIDGSLEFIRKNYPQVRVIENGANLRFAKGNNVGIQASQGEYVLILNPDTILHDSVLDKVVSFADQHPEAGAFGCRVLNADGSYQKSARPFVSVRGEWIAALNLRPLGYLSSWFQSDTYVGWKGDTQRTVDWVSGCFILVRASLLKSLGGFDEQFFYYYEDMDLCHRIRDSGFEILYTPEASITHLGGQSTSNRLPAIGFALDSQITRYLYFFKYFGAKGVRGARAAALASLLLRRLGYGLLQILKPSEARAKRLDALRVLYEWNRRVNSLRLVESGEEPDLGIAFPERVLQR